MSTPSCWGSPTCSVEWCCANHLLINPHKTKFVLFGVRQLIPKLPSNITVPFLGQDLVPVTSAKDLGVTLDANLTFNDHIALLTSLASSLLSKLVQINRVRHLFSKDILDINLKSPVFSKLFYCSTVWSGTSKGNIGINYNLRKTLLAVYSTQKSWSHYTSLTWTWLAHRLANSYCAYVK